MSVVECPQKREKTVKVVARMMNAGLSTTFQAWKRFVVMRREEKDLMRNTINRMKNSQLLIGWNGWMQFVDAQRTMERKLHMDKKEDLLPGVGSIMLAKVRVPAHWLCLARSMLMTCDAVSRAAG